MFLRTNMFPSSTGATKSTRSLVSRFAVAAWTPVTVSSMVPRGAIATLSGATTAATLKSMLSVSGVGGQMTLLTLRTNDATARTLRMKIVADGITICDTTSASVSVVDNGGVWVGSIVTTNPANPFPSISWRSTLTIEIASSVTETDKLTIEWAYNTEA